MRLLHTGMNESMNLIKVAWSLRPCFYCIITCDHVWIKLDSLIVSEQKKISSNLNYGLGFIWRKYIYKKTEKSSRTAHTVWQMCCL